MATLSNVSSNRGRGCVLVIALATLGFLTRCTDYAGYEPQPEGTHEAGTTTSTGGRISAGGTAGTGGASKDGGVEAQASGGAADSSSPPDVDALPDADGPKLITFDEGSDLSLFEFVTPEAANGLYGLWFWVPASGQTSANLVQGSSYSVLSGNGGGTYAVYQPRALLDGTIAVMHWSDGDPDSGGITFGYQDAWRQYRYAMTAAGWYLTQGIDTTSAIDLDRDYFCGSVSNLCNPLTTPHRIEIRIRHPEIRGYIDGVLRTRVFDNSYVGGQVGLYTRAHNNAHFDDFYIDFTPPTMEPIDDAGLDATIDATSQ